MVIIFITERTKLDDEYRQLREFELLSPVFQHDGQLATVELAAVPRISRPVHGGTKQWKVGVEATTCRDKTHRKDVIGTRAFTETVK